jgi:hypothetical protein
MNNLGGESLGERSKKKSAKVKNMKEDEVPAKALNLAFRRKPESRIV